MNYKNIFLMLFTLYIPTTSLYSMHIATKRLIQQKHHTTHRYLINIKSIKKFYQKNKCSIQEICFFTLGIFMITSLALLPFNYTVFDVINDIYRHNKEVYQERKALYESKKAQEALTIREQKEAYAYINSHSHKVDPYTLEYIDHEWPSRFACLSELTKKYYQCCFVQEKEVEKFWLESEKFTIDIEKYRNLFNIIAQNKKNLYDAIILIQKDMPNFQKKSAEQLAERLQLTSISYDVELNVIKQEKIGEMKNIIEKITIEHNYSSLNKIPEFKVLESRQ